MFDLQNEAIDAYQRLGNYEDDLAEAIERENFAIQQLREFEKSLEIEIGDAVSEAIFDEAIAKKGEGPFKGVAASSKAYTVILNKIENDARKPHLDRLRQLRLAVDRSSTTRQQATARFSGSRHGCDLLAAILNGHTHTYASNGVPSLN